MMKEILEMLKKCCEKIHQNDKSEGEEGEVKEQLFDILLKNNPRAIKEYNIFISCDEKTKETIEEIKEKEDFRQRDELFSGDEKWYLVYGKKDKKIDIFLSCDKIKSIPCNVIFNNCNIDLHIDELKGLKKDNTGAIKNHLYFYNCTFKKTLINLENVIFEKILTFNQCNIESEVQIYKNHFLNHLVFINCSNEQNDKKIISLDLQENEFEGYLFIKNCTIENISLWKNKFKNRCYFVDSKFGYEQDGDNKAKLNFSNAHFQDNVYFNNSHFKVCTDFHECEFEKITCFYGVEFDKAPNFSQIVFKDNFNALNITSNFVFDDLEKQIDQEHEDFNKDKKEQDKKPLDKFANDFRDSFRTFKNALIKDNNLLDASKFHKYELYCKELELKQNWNQRGKNVESMRDVEKNIWRIRDLVDFLLLGFYRKLCDHHTDFLKVINNLILLITLYTLFFRGFIWLHGDKLKDTREILTLFEFFDSFKSYFEIGSVICVIFGCGLFVYKLKSYEAKNNTSKKQKINFIYIINDFWNLIKSLFFAIFISCMFYILLFKFIGFFLNLDKDFGYSLFINILFISLYICLVYTKSLFFGRYVVLVLSYMGFFIILIKQPSIIHPLIGKIANEADKSFNYPSLMVLNILYTILLALVLFSLQKTARKNSIVPS